MLLGGISGQLSDFLCFSQENYFVKELIPVKRVLNRAPLKGVLKGVPQSISTGFLITIWR